MKLREKRLYSKWAHVIHGSLIATFITLIIVLPVLYTKTGSPPYWSIWVTFGLLSLLYIIYWVILLVFAKSSSKSTPRSDSSNTNREHTVNMPYGNETLGLQTSASTMHSEEEDEDDVETLETMYNPSTMGIPPSSFLAPTINQQASIRSSSLDYTPPPPAYQDMIYPPSYRSTNSTKDDNMSIIQSINNNNNNQM